MFDTLLNPIMSPLLSIPPLVAVILVSFILSVIIIIVYKLMTDQQKMKKLKTDIKKYQKEAKSHRNNPQKMMSVQKKAMDLNMKYMMQSFKPTFITFIPIILTFGWLNANFAYEPINPFEQINITVEAREVGIDEINLSASSEINILSKSTQEFVDKKATWTIEGTQELKTTLNFFYSGGGFFSKEITISNDQKYSEPEKKLDSPMKNVKLDMDKRIILDLGFLKLTWLWTYIIFSLIFSISLRKILKIY